MVVGDGSDLGGGASIMGTLSGGGKEVITVGQRCLIGANAGIGIPLGDDVRGRSGPVRHLRDERHAARRDRDRRAHPRGPGGMLFRRNSVSGTVEVLARAGRGIVLNAVLHTN